MNCQPSVLVIADDAAICALLDRQLTAQGYAVRTACGRDATPARLDGEPPDLLLYDRFPACRETRVLTENLRHRFPSLPSVGFSPRFRQPDAPGVDFLPMPFARGELEAAVAVALGEARPRATGRRRASARTRLKPGERRVEPGSGNDRRSAARREPHDRVGGG